MQPDPEVWEEVRSEQHVCTQKSCARNPRCFYQALRPPGARCRSRGAESRPLFHPAGGSLPESEERGDGVLFAKDFVIFDEAHTLEDVASRHIGMEISQLDCGATCSGSITLAPGKVFSRPSRMGPRAAPWLS